MQALIRRWSARPPRFQTSSVRFLTTRTAPKKTTEGGTFEPLQPEQLRKPKSMSSFVPGDDYSSAGVRLGFFPWIPKMSQIQDVLRKHGINDAVSISIVPRNHGSSVAVRCTDPKRASEYAEILKDAVIKPEGYAKLGPHRLRVSPSRFAPAPPSRTIVIHRFPRDLSSQDLAEYLQGFNIPKVVISDYDLARGKIYLCFESISDAEACIDALNGRLYDGTPLSSHFSSKVWAPKSSQPTRELYVSNLGQLSESDARRELDPFPGVQRVAFRTFGSLPPVAFVRFASVQDAEACRKALLAKKVLKSRDGAKTTDHLRIVYSPEWDKGTDSSPPYNQAVKSSRLYVGGISSTKKESDIRAYFNSVPGLQHVKLFKGTGPAPNDRCAFVQWESAAAAEAAIERFNSKPIEPGGQPLHIAFVPDKHKKYDTRVIKQLSTKRKVRNTKPLVKWRPVDGM